MIALSLLTAHIALKRQGRIKIGSLCRPATCNTHTPYTLTSHTTALCQCTHTHTHTHLTQSFVSCQRVTHHVSPIGERKEHLQSPAFSPNDQVASTSIFVALDHHLSTPKLPYCRLCVMQVHGWRYGILSKTSWSKPNFRLGIPCFDACILIFINVYVDVSVMRHKGTKQVLKVRKILNYTRCVDDSVT